MKTLILALICLLPLSACAQPCPNCPNRPHRQPAQHTVYYRPCHRCEWTVYRAYPNEDDAVRACRHLRLRGYEAKIR